jgi:hypothetical protein
MQMVRSKVVAWKSCSVNINDACHQESKNHTLPCYAPLSGGGCPTAANKTPYTLASANQNSIYIAGLRRETSYTLRPFERKLHIHWAIAGPQWLLGRCSKKSHRKKKWHWFTPGVTKWLLKYHFVVIWVYYNYTTLTPCKTAKLLFLNGKMVKCWRFHTAGVASSKLASPTKKFPMKSST